MERQGTEGAGVDLDGVAAEDEHEAHAACRMADDRIVRGANEWPVNRPRPGCGQGGRRHAPVAATVAITSSSSRSKSRVSYGSKAPKYVWLDMNITCAWDSKRNYN